MGDGSPDSVIDRRALLSAIPATALAGCSSSLRSSQQSDDQSTSTATETPTRTQTETPTDTGTPTETESSGASSEKPTPTGGVSPIETIRPHTIPDSVPFEASVELLEQPTSDRGATITISLRNRGTRPWTLATEGSDTFPFYPSFCSGRHLAVDTDPGDSSNGCPVGGSPIARTFTYETVAPGDETAGKRTILTYDIATECFPAGKHPFSNDYAIYDSRADDEPEATFDWGFDVIIAE